jgi:UDP-4-amino-4-deoxy-L-arabinose-oxoglutarate aminotransferase
VFCDIGPDGWNMTPESVAPAVTTRTRAIVVVHTFGIASDTAGFASLGVPLVEDCCQSLGARRRGQQTGTLGQVAVYSFHATKCLTTGEGGMVVSRQRDSLAAVRQDPLAVLTDMQAVLGLRQLARYDQMLARRRAIADRYFAELPAACTETLRRYRSESMFFRFPLSVRRPFAPLQAELAAIGVQVRKGVDALLHRQVGLDDARFPNAVERFNRTVSVPLYPALADAEVESVIAACRGALAHE